MHRHSRGVLAAWCAGLVLLAPSVWGQDAAARRHVGLPEDWSEHSVVFSMAGLAQHPDLAGREPRIRHRLAQLFQGGGSRLLEPLTGQTNLPSRKTRTDWNEDLVRGHVAAGMYPAKYTFDPGAPPSCSNDYAVFGLQIAGTTGGQANFIGFNNLYAGIGGLCGSSPSVMFAYNVTTVTNGKVVLSPIISEDGTKIAFVESAPGTCIFHVLTPGAGEGTITNSAAPTMTSLTISSTSTSTTSSPWIDYFNDIAYVGVDGGLLYKVTGVFNGTPTLAGSPWPITVSAGHQLTPPVLDSAQQLLMVGSADGDLYQIDAESGAVAAAVVGALGSTSHGISAPPIVDITDGTTFVVDADDGTSAVLVELETSTLSQLAKGQIGEGGSGGTASSISQPAFNNDYYNDPSTGQILLCGTGASDLTPWEYAFSFTGTTMNTPAVFSQQIVNSTNATCTDWVEFYNPNVNGGTDFFFFGLTADCTGTGTSGCVVASTVEGAPFTTTNVNGGPSGIIVDNYSTAVQAASIYLSAEGSSTAYKFTQNGLQ